MNEILKYEDIIKYLPHRYPFLLIDKVLNVQKNERIHAIKNVSIGEPFFAGHFPDTPVMPGVLMVEALAQAAGILAAYSLGWTPEDGSLFYLGGIEGTRFKRKVIPGDTLELKIEVLKRRNKVWKFQGEAYVDGEIACISEMTSAEGSV